MGGKKPESQLRDLPTAFFYLWNKSSAGEKAKKHVFGGREVLPGIPGFDLSMSVSKWYEKWMELYKVRNLKATTIRNYEEKYGKES